jgi:hypothetical protein
VSHLPGAVTIAFLGTARARRPCRVVAYRLLPTRRARRPLGMYGRAFQLVDLATDYLNGATSCAA